MCYSRCSGMLTWEQELSVYTGFGEGCVYTSGTRPTIPVTPHREVVSPPYH